MSAQGGSPAEAGAGAAATPADEAAASLAQLLSLKRAALQAMALGRTERAAELNARQLAAAEASQPADSLITAFLLRGIVSAQLAQGSMAAMLAGPSAFADMWRTNAALLGSSKRCLALLHRRWAAGALWSATSEAEKAFFADEEDPRDTEFLGAEAYFVCARDAIRWWPSLRGEEHEARLRAVHGALKALLEKDATGAGGVGGLERCARTGRRMTDAAGPSFSMVVTNLLVLALSEEFGTTLLRQLRDVCGLTRADEGALRALQARLSGAGSAANVPLGSALAGVLAGERERARRAAADVAKHPLRACALPECGQAEPQPKAFKVCGRCRAAVYCCPAHQQEDWKRHKRADGCKAPDAA
jgi:hypothetical protein